MIAAAFIGPGTVTTAASAGASYGFDLIWVLVLSTIACIVLQVNVTKISIQTGKTVGEQLLDKFEKLKFIPIVLGFSIVFGCATYQAGNLLGATLGINLLIAIEQRWILSIIVILASIMLWFGSIQLVVRILGLIVAVMGFTFIFIALSIEVNLSELLTSSIVPVIPVDSEILVMGLIGTTIVPYNLFLGSGLSIGKSLNTSIFGLIVAISFGGLISIATLVSATLVVPPFSFEGLSSELVQKLGSWAKYLLAIGLFSAGFTSAMTAPLAAIFTARSVFPKNRKLADKKSFHYKSLWIIVMVTGLLFGFLDIRPIPAIILAQATNGIILPLIAIFILVLIQSGEKKNWSKTKIINTILLYVVVFIIVTIGGFNFLKFIEFPGSTTLILAFIIGFITMTAVWGFSHFRFRASKTR